VQHEVSCVSENLELLCHRTPPDEGHMELETEAGLKSRMRENRTYGSVRGKQTGLSYSEIL
jgi:hypothetical protein